MPLTVLVSGSSGYVGSHTVKYFAQNGVTVVGLDRVPPKDSLRPYLHHEVGDIADTKLVAQLCKSLKVEGVVHCAAFCLVGESVEKPEMYLENNFTRATTFAHTVAENGVRAFLFSSTAAVYGEPQKTPIPENHPKNPINPYGESKLKLEEELQAMQRERKLSVGIFRYFNAAGADPEAEIGEHHDPETHLIPNAILASLRGTPFQVFGDDYSTRDGTCERDFVHVWDLAEAHLNLLRRLLLSTKGGTYNLGTGKGYTIHEVLDEIDRHLDEPVKRSVKPRRPGDPSVLIADTTCAKQDLEWTPKHDLLVNYNDGVKMA